MEKRYIISDASERTGLESHVLRYWEDELGLSIPRNEMGHRYYLEEHINLFRQIKILKDQGLQLKAIKNIVKDETTNENRYKAESENVKPQADLIMFKGKSEAANVPAGNDKMAQFETIIGNIVTNALRNNNEYIGAELSHMVSDKVIKEMDYLFRLRDEMEEERYKKFDETMRNYQRSNLEAAASKSSVKKKRKWF